MQRAWLCGLFAGCFPICLGAYQPPSPPAVIGVATGPEFKLNGTLVPDNANLMPDAELASMDKTVTVHLNDDCDYLLSPNSAIRVEADKLILESGKLRARHSGGCKVAAGLYTVSGDTGNADGVVAYSGGNVQVSSLTGTLQVTGSDGASAGTVAPGTSATFGAGQAGTTGAGAGGASGATASTGASTTRSLMIYAGTLGVTLAGLGLAVDAILQPGTKSTSP